MSQVSYTANQAEVITNRFIAALAQCETAQIHNFMEDAGVLGGDLDDITQALARIWVIDQEAVWNVVGDTFYKTMKAAALCSTFAD